VEKWPKPLSASVGVGTRPAIASNLVVGYSFAGYAFAGLLGAGYAIASIPLSVYG
jgi:hypothetical protein